MKIKQILKTYPILAVILITSIYISGCGSSKSDITTDDPQRAFEIAKKKYDRQDYVDAVEDFSYIKIRFPGTEISDKVQYYLAMSYYGQKEYLLAAYELETFLKNYPLSPLYQEAKYMVGVTYYQLSPKYSLDQEYTKAALTELLTFIDLYPQDKNVPDAENKVKELRNKLAYKDYWTGELYMKNDNNKAATLYFQSVYENYIDSDWADDAMVGQAEAFINGSKFEEAKKVLDKFYKLFPKSEVKARADKLKQRLVDIQAGR